MVSCLVTLSCCSSHPSSSRKEFVKFHGDLLSPVCAGRLPRSIAINESCDRISICLRNRDLSITGELRVKCSRGSFNSRSIIRKNWDCSIRLSSSIYPVRTASPLVRTGCAGVITGFWIGPDLEDGCGFVVAVVEEII